MNNDGYLFCAHCETLFLGSKKQLFRNKYENKDGNRSFLCSPICRHAYTANKLRKPILKRGPCLTCDKMFESRVNKKYCTLSCYTKSKQFKDMKISNLKKYAMNRKHNEAKEREERIKNNQVACLECGNQFWWRPSSNKKFCNMQCYRKYFTKRYDRWIASPEHISLPQAYDEFLTQNELHCLVDNCDWHGQHLSVHMNQVHGVPAREFKRAAGFNLGTGVITSQLSQTLSERSNVGVALGPHPIDYLDGFRPTTKGYTSLEGREHHIKSRLLLIGYPGPTRKCQHCKKEFQQATVFGHAKFCSIKCRYIAHQLKVNVKIYDLVCCYCAKSFKGNKFQHKRQTNGDNVVCSTTCRAFLNSSKRKKLVRTDTWSEKELKLLRE